MFCATSALGISWQHRNHLNLLVRSAYYSMIIIVFVMTVTLMQMKHGCIGIGLITQPMIFLVMK